MRILQLCTLIFCLSIFSSCDILKDLTKDQMNKHLVCIPALGGTYQNSYQIIAGKRMEHDKLKTSQRETTRLKCLSTKQIRQIGELLRMEHSRLKYAKYAYQYCSNPEDYYLNMQSLLRMDHSKRELERRTRR